MANTQLQKVHALRSIPFMDLRRIHDEIEEELTQEFKEVLRKSSFIGGQKVEGFEALWAEYNSCRYCVSCSSGTTALELALKSLDIGNGDEVITVSNTFFATVEAILNVGAQPRFVDVNANDGLMDVSQIESSITNKTKAIIPVHLYGQMCDMDAIRKIADKYNLCIIEDAAQSHGAIRGGNRVGALSTVACFSFYPGKNLGALGDAGALVTNDAKLAERARCLRNHGRIAKYEHIEFGYNMRMDALQGAFLAVKTKRLDDWTADRRRIAGIYLKELSDVKGIQIPAVHDGINAHVFHLFVILCERRDALRNCLIEKGIATGIHYPIPCHSQPAWLRAFGKMSLPVTERWADSCISLPMFARMTDEEAMTVCAAVKDSVREIGVG